MPFFDDFYANKLRGTLGLTNAEAVLDLRGAPSAQAEASIKDMLERSRFGAARTVAIRLDAPTDGGGETLFQPIGRQLLEARRRGWVDRLQTLPPRDGLGFFVGLAGNPKTV